MKKARSEKRIQPRKHEREKARKGPKRRKLFLYHIITPIFRVFILSCFRDSFLVLEVVLEPLSLSLENRNFILHL
jgi:hypothetical protein